MHVPWTFALEWQMILGQGGCLLSANKKHGEVNLDDLDVGRRSRRNSALLWRLGVLRHNLGESNLMFWVEGVGSRVSSSIFLLTICLVTQYSKMQNQHSISRIKCNLGFFVDLNLGDGE
jgi:hypothetical protein